MTWRIVVNTSERKVWHHENGECSIAYFAKYAGHINRVEYLDNRTGDNLDHMNTFENQVGAFKYIFLLMEEYQ